MVYHNRGRSKIRKEDLPHYKMLEANKPIIRGLINHLTGGRLQQKQPQPAEPERTKSFYIGNATGANEPGPAVVKIALNGRVLLVDENRAKQLMHFGNVVTVDGQSCFRLATAENGFFAPLEAPIRESLQDLDGCALSGEFTEESLVQEISTRLSLNE